MSTRLVGVVSPSSIFGWVLVQASTHPWMPVSDRVFSLLWDMLIVHMLLLVEMTLASSLLVAPSGPAR